MYVKKRRITTSLKLPVVMLSPLLLAAKMPNKLRVHFRHYINQIGASFDAVYAIKLAICQYLGDGYRAHTETRCPGSAEFMKNLPIVFLYFIEHRFF